MTPDFWHERWHKGEIGWHLEEVNAHLSAHWPRLAAPPGTQVFVPLCGKTLDLLWLAAQGHRVLGVEISPIAVEGFFADHRLNPVVVDDPPFRRYALDELSILCGDFFDLTPAHLGDVIAVYDRASLIALPPGLRPRYVEHLRRLMQPATRALLITLDYDQGQMAGPPFAVPEAEVHTLLGSHFDIRRVALLDVLDDSPRFRQRGLTRLDELVYELYPKADASP